MKQSCWIFVLLAVVLVAGCVTGSGGSSSELDQLSAEAAGMGKTDLEAMVAKYKGLIAEKTDLGGSLQEQLKKVPLTEMMGEKATALKQELGETTTLIAQLKEKLAIYTDALKAFQ